MTCEADRNSYQAISYENIIMAFILIPLGAILAGVVLSLEIHCQRGVKSFFKKYILLKQKIFSIDAQNGNK